MRDQHSETTDLHTFQGQLLTDGHGAPASGTDSLRAQNELLQAQLAEAKGQVGNLEIALESSRRIGAAVGIIMSQRHVAPDDAFEILRMASQARNVKIRDLAEQVVYTGSLD